LVVAVVGGYPAGLVLGIPAYVLLRRRLRPHAATMAAVGGSIAPHPVCVVAARLADLLEYERIGDCDDHRRRQDVVRLSGGDQALAIIFAFGVLGGLTFWLCVAWRGRTGDAARDRRVVRRIGADVSAIPIRLPTRRHRHRGR
jgi:hypothetical protein